LFIYVSIYLLKDVISSYYVASNDKLISEKKDYYQTRILKVLWSLRTLQQCNVA